MSAKPSGWNPFALTGKRILVTGASSGIGRQLAQTCALMGAEMILTGRDPDRLKQAHDSLAGANHAWYCADLTVNDQIRALVQVLPSLDGVVHSAGVQRLAPVHLLSEKLVRGVLETNFIAPVMLTQQLLHRGVVASGGSILFLSSSAAHTGTAGVASYAASKAALHGFMRCLVMEQAKRRVRVNCIVPSAVDTPLWDRQHLEAQRVRHPLGLGTVDDVAHAAIYFLSDASRWVTGAEFVMDGGILLAS
jgi:NAD(P)-dependent dehydrogenase (short-subunit alcohol dehydrogenase family)